MFVVDVYIYIRVLICPQPPESKNKANMDGKNMILLAQRGHSQFPNQSKSYQFYHEATHRAGNQAAFHLTSHPALEEALAMDLHGGIRLLPPPLNKNAKV